MEHASHRLLTEVATSVLPLVVLILKHRCEQAKQRISVGEDTHHLGAPVELGVDSLDGVGRGDRAPVVDWKVQVGEHIGSAASSMAATVGKRGSSTLRAWFTASRAVSRVGCRKTDLTTASTAGARGLGTALATLRRKCTLQRCGHSRARDPDSGGDHGGDATRLLRQGLRGRTRPGASRRGRTRWLAYSRQIVTTPDADSVADEIQRHLKRMSNAIPPPD